MTMVHCVLCGCSVIDEEVYWERRAMMLPQSVEKDAPKKVQTMQQFIASPPLLKRSGSDVYELIERHPGTTIEQLAGYLGKPWSTTYPKVKRLIGTKKVGYMPHGYGEWRLFTTRHMMETTMADVDAALEGNLRHDKTREKILRYIHNGGGKIGKTFQDNSVRKQAIDALMRIKNKKAERKPYIPAKKGSLRSTLAPEVDQKIEAVKERAAYYKIEVPSNALAKLAAMPDWMVVLKHAHLGGMRYLELGGIASIERTLNEARNSDKESDTDTEFFACPMPLVKLWGDDTNSEVLRFVKTLGEKREVSAAEWAHWAHGLDRHDIYGIWGQWFVPNLPLLLRRVFGEGYNMRLVREADKVRW